MASTPGFVPPTAHACQSHAADQMLGGDATEILVVKANPNYHLAPGAGFNTLIVRNARTARKLRRLEEATPSAVSAAFSPDGRMLAVGTLDGEVYLWKVASGQRLHVLQSHSGPVYDVAFSPDGGMLASGSADGTVVLWDVLSGQALRGLDGHQGGVVSVAFSPDGAALAAGTSAGTVVLWEVERGERLHTLGTPGEHVSQVAFSADGSVLAAASLPDHVTLWNPAAGTLKNEIQAERVGGIAFSPDGALLAVAQPGSILLVDLVTYRQVHELVGYEETLYDRVVFDDDTTVIAGSPDETGVTWQLAPSADYCKTWLKMSSSVVTASAAPPAGPTRFPASAPGSSDALDGWEFGSLVYELYSPSGERSIWLLVGDQQPRALPKGSFLGLSPDGCSLLYIRSTLSRQEGREFVVLDVPMTAERFVFSSYELWDTGVYDIAWSPDSVHLALTLGGTAKRSYSGNLWLLDTSDGTATRITFSGGGEPLYSPDGKWIATSTPEIGNSHGSVGLWGAEGQGGRGLFDPIWSHSKRWAADSSGFSLALTRLGIEGSELWWVPVDGAPVQIGHLPVDNVAWLPGGKRYTYYTDRPRRANWDGSEDVEVPGLEGKTSGQWSPDGRRLFARDEEGSAYIVDADGLDAPVKLSGKCLHAWLDETPYLASTTSEGSTSLYVCALPESCQLLAQIDGPISRMQYIPQRCTRTDDIPVLPSPTPEENDIPVLIEAMLHGSGSVSRGEAASRLGNFGAREGIVPALVQAMQEDPHMRWAVCEGLAKIGPDAMEAVPALIEALEDECSTEHPDACAVERSNLSRALRSITGQEFGPDAAAWRAWWNEQQ